MKKDSKEENAYEFASSRDFMTKIEKVTYIENPLNELATSPTAIIYYGKMFDSLQLSF